MATETGQALMTEAVKTAYVADSIDRVGGDVAGFGYSTSDAMAVDMLDRFPMVGTMAAEYAASTANARELDSVVCDALAAF
jgi:hypothetical protein